MSGIQGFPSDQKLILGATQTNNFVTVVPTDPHRHAIDSLRFAFRVGSDTIARVAGATTGVEAVAGTKMFWVEDVATPARKGDFVRFIDGASQFIEFPIIKVEADRFLLAVVPSLAPVSGDEFFIMRYVTQRTAQDGSQFVSLTPVVYQAVEKAKLDAGATAISDAAWTELIAATSDQFSEIEIFNKTGMLLILGVGAPGAEIELIYIDSDGLKRQSIPVAAGSRLSLKAVQAAVNDGLVLLNAFG